MNFIIASLLKSILFLQSPSPFYNVQPTLHYILSYLFFQPKDRVRSRKKRHNARCFQTL